MEIINTQREETILNELGRRIKEHRILLNMTQAELAEKCGISISTETRIENGEDSKISNYLKILFGLNMSDNIDMLIPEVQPDFKSLYEGKKNRQRVKKSKSQVNTSWIWGEDK